MKEYFKIAMFLIGIIMAVSCVDNDPDNCKGGGVVDENGEMTREFILQLPSPVRRVSTYASMTEDDENKIDELVILAFRINGSNETFAYQAKATAIDDMDSGSDTKKVSVKLKVSDDYYRFVFLANVSGEVEEQLGDIATIGEKDLVLQKLTHSCAAEKQWDDTDCFPMWGESDPWQIKEDDTDDKHVKMIRAVSRIDVVSTTNNFKVVSAHLYQFHRKGHVVPHPDNIENDKTSHTATTPEDSLMVKKSQPYSAVNDELIRTIYTYESYKNPDHLDKTCLVVGGVYYPEDYKAGDPEPSVTWYRIDFVDSDNKDIHLLRNYCYTLRIRSVAGEGYTDPDEAYEAKPFNIIVDLLEWNQGDIRDIVFNGQYFLGVSESEIYMPKPAADTSIIITTDYPGGWTPTYESSDKNGDEWLTHVSGHFTDEKEKDELVFHLTENGDGALRTGYIHLKAGVLKHTITVYQDIDEPDGPPTDVTWLDKVGDANCYILSPYGDGIRIPVLQANNDGIERIKDNDVLEVEVLWTDTSYPVGNENCVIKYAGVNGQGKSGHLEIVASKGIWGNALVAVKVNNIIRWSWHIWVQEFHPDDTQKEYNGDVTEIWMDRNLGALSAERGSVETMGFTYQFGRKDPFPGMASFLHASPTKIYNSQGIETFIKIELPNSSLDMLEESIKNPMTYYQGFGSSNDWYSNSSRETDFWYKDGGGVTTPYDPCPDGWTINTKVAVWWEKWNLGFSTFVPEYGIYSTKIGYWPTPGYRDNTGSLLIDEVGTIGYYWMGQPNGWSFGNAIEIDLRKNGNDAIETGKGKNKAWGLSVRCVKAN